MLPKVDQMLKQTNKNLIFLTDRKTNSKFTPAYFCIRIYAFKCYSVLTMHKIPSQCFPFTIFLQLSFVSKTKLN